MTGDKEKLESYTALEKGKQVSFGNDTPAAIKGKCIAQLKEDVKAGNVLYVDGLKHNLLSVSQMCDNGTEVIFRSDGCRVHDLDTGRTVIEGKITPNNLYIFEEGEQQCYLSKNDEHWLWHRRLGHLSFSQIRKACKYQAVRGLLDIKIPDNTICKSCQFGKQTRTNFLEKEGSASRPLELVHTDVNHEDIEEDEDYSPNQTDNEEEPQEAPEEQITIEEKTPSRYVQKSHPESQILGQKEAGVQTRRTIAEASSYLALLSSTEPQNILEACKDERWVKEMDEELEQIEKNNTWELVARPKDKNVIGTKWIFKNKLNENGEVVELRLL
eukprot:PITA_17372